MYLRWQLRLIFIVLCILIFFPLYSCFGFWAGKALISNWLFFYGHFVSQMTKLAIIPCTVFLETLFFKKHFRLVILYSCRISWAMNIYDTKSWIIIILWDFQTSSWTIVNILAFTLQSCIIGLAFLSDNTCVSICSKSIQGSLLILLVGVGIATVTDLQLNVLGSILSLLAVITTCIAQIVSFIDVTLAVQLLL